MKSVVRFGRLIGAALWLTSATFPALADDRIALSCFGGVTGGGRVTFITPQGEISRYDCGGPSASSCAPPIPMGSDPAAYARWSAALDREHFETINQEGGFGEGSCSLLRERNGTSHSTGFVGLPDSPGSLPRTIARVVRELGIWHNR